jgi:hypothetical protein
VDSHRFIEARSTGYEHTLDNKSSVCSVGPDHFENRKIEFMEGTALLPREHQHAMKKSVVRRGVLVYKDPKSRGKMIIQVNNKAKPFIHRVYGSRTAASYIRNL